MQKICIVRQISGFEANDTIPLRQQYVRHDIGSVLASGTTVASGQWGLSTHLKPTAPTASFRLLPSPVNRCATASLIAEPLSRARAQAQNREPAGLDPVADPDPRIVAALAHARLGHRRGSKGGSNAMRATHLLMLLFIFPLPASHPLGLFPAWVMSSSQSSCPRKFSKSMGGDQL